MELTVYGAEVICASCVQAPSSRATAEWLDAALSREFGGQVTIRYVSILSPETEQDRVYCERIHADEFFFPLVVSGDTVLGEGFISLGPIVKFLHEQGIESISESSQG
ncbi:DUF1462 family protein [Sporolactobacillus vineae]|uniref:DUF1462 family protein n=1 Tax=Sporolactobacillus vineae TaxID=444463 RepID=UPI000287C02D|nr:DUF1462 family protein [Sporolactobacillus vineae]